MKKIKIIANILFWITLVSPMVSFSLASIIGEADIFGVAGIVRYSWVMWFFIPIGILSIIVAGKLKQAKLKYKKNYVVAFICLPLLILFGSYRFIFSDISYDVNRVVTIEQKANLELPNRVKIVTEKIDSYYVSYLKIINAEEQRNFESEIESNLLWEKELSTKIKSLLPFDIQYELTNFDYFVFYNSTTSEYNEYPTDGQYDCVFVAYDHENKRLIILDDYKINLS